MPWEFINKIDQGWKKTFWNSWTDDQAGKTYWWIDRCVEQNKFINMVTDAAKDAGMEDKVDSNMTWLISNGCKNLRAQEKFRSKDEDYYWKAYSDGSQAGWDNGEFSKLEAFKNAGVEYNGCGD